MTTNHINERELVLDILIEVNENHVFSHQAIRRMLEKYQYLNKAQRSFITRVAKGTIEWQIKEDYIIEQYSKVPIKKMKPVIREIIRMGVYQIFYMDRVPDAAVCNEAVKLAQKRGFFGLKGFVNGVLRTIARNKNSIPWISKEKEVSKYFSITYSMPEWIVKKWMKNYTEETVEKMLKTFVKENQTSVRMILTGTQEEQEKRRRDIIESLKNEGVSVQNHPYFKNALQISEYDYLEDLEVFEKGWITVQDVSSMLTAKIANPQKGDFCIDVCAAPGGKSIHLAELLDETGMVEARDVSEYKLDLMEENIERTRLKNIRTKLMDGTQFDTESIEKADLVLADVPCSGLGVIGKKYDLKYHMTEEKIKDICCLQKEIVQNAAAYVKKGKSFVYSTCTINQDENEKMVEWIEKNTDLKTVNLQPFLREKQDICLPDDLYQDAERGFLQFLPGIHACDGFFIARFEKK